jgi:hypothetical protein
MPFPRTDIVLCIIAMLVVLCLSATMNCPAQHNSEESRHEPTDADVPGTVTPVLDRDPPGYLVCTLVRKYFNEETSGDLRDELDLEAHGQFLRFLVVGRTATSRESLARYSDFRNVSLWWEEDALLGLYFVPLSGIELSGSEDSETNPKKASNDKSVPSAAEMLVEARLLRKQRHLEDATRLLVSLRKQYPLSPEARRALREMYFMRTEPIGPCHQAE